VPDLIERARQNVSLLASAPALVHEQAGTITWGELGTRIDALVAGLRARGGKPGQRVGIAIYNGTLALQLYLAAQAAGLQPVLLGSTLREHLLTAVRDLKIAELFVGPECEPWLAQAAALGARTWLVTEAEQTLTEAGLAGAGADTSWVPARPENQVAGIQYTTGTTGLPKAMVRSVGSDFWDAVNRSLTMRIRHSERWVAASPTNINVAIGALRCMTLMGGTVIALDDVSPASIERNTREGVTILPLQAPGWRELLASGIAQQLPARGLRVAVSTGQRTPRPLLAALKELMDGHGEVVNSYGLTETSTISALTSSMADYEATLVAGRPNPMQRVDVAPYRDAVADAGDCGEIRVAGPAVSPGYLTVGADGTVAMPEAGDGWFYSGDVGRWDSHGNLCVLGRWKDAVAVAGRYVYPYAVENTAQEIDGIEEAVLLGLPDGTAPDGTAPDGPAARLLLVVQPAAGTEADETALAKVLAELPAGVPASWMTVATMPRNSSRKIDRAAVARLAAAGSPGNRMRTG
jgi:acyl-CoA synthetase (AMP-forming)/AMP-acid ligase II